MKDLKIYEVEFEGVYLEGCLILVAYNQEQAEEMAQNTIGHTDKMVVKEVVVINKPQIIIYNSGDY